jgi:hypothetical protein
MKFRVDETNWPTVSARFLTCAMKSEELMNCIVDNDGKEGVTVIAAIFAVEWT